MGDEVDEFFNLAASERYSLFGDFLCVLSLINVLLCPIEHFDGASESFSGTIFLPEYLVGDRQRVLSELVELGALQTFTLNDDTCEVTLTALGVEVAVRLEVYIHV